MSFFDKDPTSVRPVRMQSHNFCIHCQQKLNACERIRGECACAPCQAALRDVKFCNCSEPRTLVAMKVEDSDDHSPYILRRCKRCDRIA